MRGEGYFRAKVEHYLQRAEGYIRTARFVPARETIETILSLDPENSAGKSLEKRLDYLLNSILHRGSQLLVSNNGDGVDWTRPRRDELVLIVDQDDRLVELLVEHLRRHGLNVIASANFEEAIKTLSFVRPDLIISEVNFENGPEGFDLYLWIRTNAVMCEVPFLFLATRIDRDTLIAGKRLGVDDFVFKPVDQDVVMASIINCLSRRKKMLAKK
jgi:PleD family two-component response regulator